MEKTQAKPLTAAQQRQRDKKRRTWLRTGVQLFFFVSMPGAFVAGFSGVKQIFLHIGAGEVLSVDSFTLSLLGLCGFTLLFDRFFCGYACAFGSLGDAVWALSGLIQKKLFHRKKQLRLPERAVLLGQKVKYLLLAWLVALYVTRQDQPHGKIPTNMLWCDTRKGHERYIWYNSPGKRQMFFSERLNIPDGTFHVPGVIYRASGDRLEIFAYKGEAPAEDSPLFLAPFFNVTGSSVCLGNASLTPPENMTFSKLLEHWEKRFWLSEFSHLGGSRNPTESNLVSVTEKARTNPFDYNELKPMDRQLKDLLI